MAQLLKSLNKAAEAKQLATVWSAPDSRMICLSPHLNSDSKVSSTPQTPNIAESTPSAACPYCGEAPLQ